MTAGERYVRPFKTSSIALISSSPAESFRRNPEAPARMALAATLASRCIVRMTNLLVAPRFLSEPNASSPLTEGMFRSVMMMSGRRRSAASISDVPSATVATTSKRSLEQFDQAFRNNRVVVGDQNTGAAHRHPVSPPANSRAAETGSFTRTVRVVPWCGAVSIREPSAHQPNPLLDAAQAEAAALLPRLGKVEPLPVVGYCNLRLVLDPSHGDGDPPGAGVFRDVAQRLLDDPVEAQRGRRVGNRQVVVGLDDHGD